MSPYFINLYVTHYLNSYNVPTYNFCNIKLKKPSE